MFHDDILETQLTFNLDNWTKIVQFFYHSIFMNPYDFITA